MAFTHNTHRLPWKPEGKTNFRASPFSLFLSLHFIECLKYNIRYLLASKILIPKSELQNHGPKTICRKTVESKPFFFGVLPLNHHIHIANMVLSANTFKSIGGP